jgi:outer membrane usher protein FimD/PapC
MNYNNRLGSKDNRLSSFTTIEYRDKKTSLNTNIRYQHPRFSTNLDYQIQSDNRQNTTLNVNTAVVFADGVFAVSAPINESFALLTGPNENKRAIAVRKGSGSFRHATGAEDKLPERYDAVIDGFGAAVIPNLHDYSLEHIQIDNKALPLGADFTKTDFDLQPSYHQGYHLRAGGEVGVIVDGYLIGKNNKKLALEGGELHCENNTGIPFFTNRAGRFRLMSVPTGKCQLLLFSLPKLTSVFFMIPNKKGKIYNLGEIIISN